MPMTVARNALNCLQADLMLLLTDASTEQRQLSLTVPATKLATISYKSQANSLALQKQLLIVMLRH